MSSMSSASDQFHAVRFYSNSASLCGTVADFVREGLGRRTPAVVIATPAHLAQIVTRLSRVFDIQTLETDGDLLLLDANEMLSRVMRAGMPDASRFSGLMTPILEHACLGRRTRAIRLYGETVDVLWKTGRTVAAVRLERLWNQLANSRDFSLRCSYTMGHFYKEATRVTSERHRRSSRTPGGRTSRAGARP
jgi:DcmR-like sensory protein